MCIKTVEGVAGELRSVTGLAGSERTIDGDIFSDRTVSGISTSGGTTLLGTKPTFTSITTAGAGSYTTPAGCAYIEVYLNGAGGGGAGGLNTNRKQGGSGASGGIAFGFFNAGTYSYDLKAGGAGGAASADGVAAVGDSTFGTLSASGGGGGLVATVNGATVYQAATSGTATNSLLPLGIYTASPPGLFGTNGGASVFRTSTARGKVSTAAVNGAIGIRGSGGAGGVLTGTGGDGGPGALLIIEYY